MADVRKEVDIEESRETGTAFIIAGWLFLLFGLMVILFFHPSSPRWNIPGIRNISIVLVIVGLILNFWGYRLRKNVQ